MPEFSALLVDLYSDLGYHPEYPPREIKFIRNAVDAFFAEYKKAGNQFHRPRNEIDLGAATLCAQSFLEEENRGSIFFCNALGVNAPCSPRDRDM